MVAEDIREVMGWIGGAVLAISFGLMVVGWLFWAVRRIVCGKQHKCRNRGVLPRVLPSSETLEGSAFNRGDNRGALAKKRVLIVTLFLVPFNTIFHKKTPPLAAWQPSNFLEWNTTLFLHLYQ